MKNTKELIGRKVKGFKFEPSKIGYSCFMDDFVDKVGVVKEFSTDNTSCIIEFDSNNSYYYPADQIESHLVEEENEIPTLSDGVMMLVSDSKINWYDKDVKFIYNGRYYTFEEHNLTFVPWIHCKPLKPTKEEQLTKILGNSDKVAEIMELFKDKK